jgi:aminoglycoside phosphotransferase (APT) family kinase protein
VELPGRIECVEITMKLPIDSTAPVRSGEELPVDRLEACLRQHFPDASGSLTVEQFPHGHSNLTYLLRLGEREMVMRRPPFGNQVKSAHDMGREFRVLSKLSAVYPPAPRPYFYCEDEAVLGAPFYVMERRKGIVLRRVSPGSSPIDAASARQLGLALVDNLARLHLLDYKAAGLEDLGKPEGYVSRQVNGWIKRWSAARTEDHPTVERIGAWLAGHMPAESGAALIHNDYKFDNLLLDPEDLTRIVAVLDWEMATVGDPLMDLGSTLGYWVEATDPPAFQPVATGPSNVPGNLTRQEVVDRYAHKTGRAVPDVLFYYCYGLYKMAVILQQIYARYFRGHTKDARFARMNTWVEALGQQAEQTLEKGRV